MHMCIQICVYVGQNVTSGVPFLISILKIRSFFGWPGSHQVGWLASQWAPGILLYQSPLQAQFWQCAPHVWLFLFGFWGSNSNLCISLTESNCSPAQLLECKKLIPGDPHRKPEVGTHDIKHPRVPFKPHHGLQVHLSNFQCNCKLSPSPLPTQTRHSRLSAWTLKMNGHVHTWGARKTR